MDTASVCHNVQIGFKQSALHACTAFACFDLLHHLVAGASLNRATPTTARYI